MFVQDIDVAGADGNYKGLLIQYCQERGLSQPRFTETQHGTSDAPSWKVTVYYGDRVHETEFPIPGAKKNAHQFAAKQILDAISENREKLLTGEALDEQDNSVAEPIELIVSDEPIEMPLPIFTSAMEIANERLSDAQPTRYRSISDTDFSRKLAQLTVEIAIDLKKAADAKNLKFPDK